MSAAPGRPVTDLETGQHKANGNGELLLNLPPRAREPGAIIP
jgi:hypothetical protein